MTGIVSFQTKHGVVAVEVDEDVAASLREGQETPEGLTPKGGYRPAAKGGAVVAELPEGKFEQALSSLKAYAGNLLDLVQDLDVTPEEVTVEVGLKFAGEAGFILAKAGAETEMKVGLTWKPGAGKTAGQ